jgi:uncharacterized membrane protein
MTKWLKGRFWISVPRYSVVRLPAGYRARIRRPRRKKALPWRIPLAYSLAGITLGLSLPRVENRWLPELLAPMSAAVAIAIDSSVAAGMITLTGIVFALVFVMVQFGAVAYSPRLVPWIARDPLLMHAMGMFSATFLYALSALAWVDRFGSGRVPFASTGFVIVLLLASVGMLISLVHRLGLLQVQSILIFTAERGRRLIDGLYPPLNDLPAAPDMAALRELPVTQTLIDHGHPQTIQALDVAALLSAARASGGVIEVAVAVGDTIGEGIILLRVYEGRQPVDEKELNRAFILGNERTVEQDPKYAIRLLVDVAIRALSPAVNDPTTAVQALDHIEDLLLRLGRRRLEIGAFCDDDGDLRLVLSVPAWEDFVTLALEEIRSYGASSEQVMRRMGALLSDLLHVLPEERHDALRRQKDRLRAAIARSFADDESVMLASVEDRQGLGAPRRQRAGS